MARFGMHRTTSVQAKEDLSGKQYCAIAFDDGKLAANGAEACGLIINKPKSNEHATIGFDGEMKFRAGGAVAATKAMTINGSGTCTAAGSGDYIVGRNGNAAVTSGSIGTGFFDFKRPVYAPESSFAW